MTVDGQAFDFSQLPEGGVLPASAIQHDAFAGPVKRVGGALEMTLLLSHGAKAPQETLFPAPVRMTSDGVVPLPPYDGEDE